MPRPLAIGLLLLGAACATRQEVDPFLIPPAELERIAAPLVLTPTVVPPDIPIPESVLVDIDTQILEALRGAGLPVVPVDDYLAIWERIVLEVGGVVDPESGERDPLRFEDARELLAEELWEGYGAGTLLYPEFVVVTAPVTGGVAQWDGVRSRVTRQGSFGEILGWILGTPSVEGWVQALSFWITIETTGGTEIYAAAGGVEVLEALSDDGTQWVPIPSERIGHNAPAVAAAVRRALTPLASVAERP